MILLDHFHQRRNFRRRQSLDAQRQPRSSDRPPLFFAERANVIHRRKGKRRTAERIVPGAADRWRNAGILRSGAGFFAGLDLPLSANRISDAEP